MESEREIEKGVATADSFLLASATAEEIEVAEIMVGFRSSILSLSESLSNWVCRRRRSSPDPQPLPLVFPRIEPPPQENRIEEENLTVQAAPAEQEKFPGGADISPDTPLAFFPDAANEKPEHYPKKSSKKPARTKLAKEEYLDTIKSLTQLNETLTRELEKKKEYYNKLKAYNSQLKAKKQEVESSPVVNSEGLPELMASVQEHQSSSSTIAAHSHPSDARVGSDPWKFDLNLPAEEEDEHPPLDFSIAIVDGKEDINNEEQVT